MFQAKCNYIAGDGNYTLITPRKSQKHRPKRQKAAVEGGARAITNRRRVRGGTIDAREGLEGGGIDGELADGRQNPADPALVTDDFAQVPKPVGLNGVRHGRY